MIPEVEDGVAKAISVVLPKDDEKFANLDAYQSLPLLLSDPKCQEKVKYVVTFRKKRSGSVYSFGQLTTAPHQTHLAEEAGGVHGAAALAGLPHLCLNGDMSIVQEDATFLAPGTDDYRNLGIEEAFAGVTEEVLGAVVNGCERYGAKAPVNEQKRKEYAGGSRKAFNLGVGWSGHGFEKGVDAPEGEFADVQQMNMKGVRKHFPDEGRCLGVLFEALGKAQEAIVERLDLGERPDPERNEKYAGEIGIGLFRKGCQAGECLFLSLECANSEIMGHVMGRLSGKRAVVTVDGKQVHLHVDGQNPDPLSGYSRVVMATWTVYFACEGELCPMQLTAILCNRRRICDRYVNNEAVAVVRTNYQSGLLRFTAEQPDPAVRYEQDGWGLFAGAEEVVVSYLEDEPTEKERLIGCWVAHERVDGPERFRLVRAKASARSLETVGDQRLGPDPRRKPRQRRAPCDPAAKGTSDVEAIERPGSGVPHARMRLIRACPNKLGHYCSQRAAAQKVVDQFALDLSHVWNLYYCSLQHYISPAVYIAKCLSLVHQWDELWRPPNAFGVKWLAAVKADGLEGDLASVFMNMTVPAHCDRVSSKLKRVTGSHTDKAIVYTPDFCREQIDLLQSFAGDVVGSSDKRSTADILQKNLKGPDATLGKLVHVGLFVAPQVIPGLFLWGLEPRIPCWRAADCPILDLNKKHLQANMSDLAGQVELLRSLTGVYKVKSIESAHRCLLIIAHEKGTSVITIENGACEGVRGNDVFDFLVENMVSLDLRPAADSSPYRPRYELWKKEYGPDAKWERVESSRVAEVLNMARS